MKIHIEHKLTVLVTAFTPVANAWGDDRQAWDLLNGWLGPVANRWLLLRALPAKVLEIANKDRTLRPHFRALPWNLRNEAIDRAVGRLLGPVDGLGPASMELLDCDDYEDGPDGDIFAWDGWKLIRRAVGWAIKSLTTQHARETALPDDVGSWHEPCEEASDIDPERLHTPEGQAELVAAHPVIDGLIRDGISLTEAQQIILALVLDLGKMPSASKVQRLTGMNRRRVRRSIDEIAKKTDLLAELQRSIAERDARASLYESRRARTPPAKHRESDTLRGIDRKLDNWTHFDPRERLAQPGIADEKRARESALTGKSNAGVAPGVLRDPNIAAPPGSTARYAEGTHSADCHSAPKSAVEVLPT